MKLILILLVLFTSSTSLYSADAPKEIEDVLKRYEATVAAAVKPLRDRYIQELQQIKSRAMLLKNLELAVAVDAELKKLAAVETPSSPKSRYAGTRWKDQFGYVAAFDAGGRFSETARNGTKVTGTWKAISDSDVLVQRIDNRTENFVLQPDGQSLRRKEDPTAIWRLVK